MDKSMHEMTYVDAPYELFEEELKTLIGRGEAAGIDTTNALSVQLGDALVELVANDRDPKRAREYLRIVESYVYAAEQIDA